MNVLHVVYHTTRRECSRCTAYLSQTCVRHTSEPLGQQSVHRRAVVSPPKALVRGQPPEGPGTPPPIRPVKRSLGARRRKHSSHLPPFQVNSEGWETTNFAPVLVPPLKLDVQGPGAGPPPTSPGPTPDYLRLLPRTPLGETPPSRTHGESHGLHPSRRPVSSGVGTPSVIREGWAGPETHDTPAARHLASVQVAGGVGVRPGRCVRVLGGGPVPVRVTGPRRQAPTPVVPLVWCQYRGRVPGS